MIHVTKPAAPDLKKDRPDAIKAAYHNKCGYCEQKQEEMQVEHYRPQAHYDWLKDTWCNLLLACPKCNKYKSDCFPIRNKAGKITDIQAETINENEYDQIEFPLIINPETELYPENHFRFTTEGKIISNTLQGKVTIKVCKLNREYLIVKRKEVIDFLENSIKEKVVFEESECIVAIIKKFIETIRNPENEFIALRKHILEHELKQWY